MDRELGEALVQSRGDPGGKRSRKRGGGGRVALVISLVVELEAPDLSLEARHGLLVRLEAVR